MEWTGQFRWAMETEMRTTVKHGRCHNDIIQLAEQEKNRKYDMMTRASGNEDRFSYELSLRKRAKTKRESTIEG